MQHAVSPFCCERVEQALQEDKMKLPKVIKDDLKNHRRKKGLLKAYVLITTEYGCQQEVRNKVQSIPEVKEAYKLHGIYDLIVDIEVEDIKNLKELINRRIRRLDKVRSTITLIENIEENEIRGKYFI